jgi:outer membrane protein TolC
LDYLYEYTEDSDEIFIIENLNIQKENYEFQKNNLESQIKSLKNELSSTAIDEQNSVKLQIYELEKQLEEINFELSLFDDDKLYKQARISLKSEVLSSYIELYYIDLKIKQNKQTVNYYKIFSESQTDLFKAGKAIENAAEIAKAQYNSAVNDLKAAERELPFARESLAFLFNHYEDEYNSFKIEKPVKETSFPTSEDVLLDTFLEKNVDLLRLENKIKIEENYLDKCKPLWGAESTSVKIQENVIRQCEMEYERAKEQLSLSVAKAYSEYESAVEAYKASLSYIKVLNEGRRINKVLYDEGEISKLDYLKNDLQYSNEIFATHEDYFNLIIIVDSLKAIEYGVIERE